MKIPVVFATDENYMFYTCVAIASLSKSAGLDTFYQIYILVGEQFRDESNWIYKLNEKYQNIQAQLLPVDNRYFTNVTIHNNHVTKATFYRLILSQLLAVDRCIYLDSDVIVTEDLSALYQVDMAENYVAGCRDIWIDLLTEEAREARRKRTGIPSMEQYINAGVLVMNLGNIRKAQVEKAFIEQLSADYLFEDQDILNVCCYDRIFHLPARWNIFTLFLGQIEDMRQHNVPESVIEQFRAKKGIIHYATPFIRPWSNRICWAAREWWDVAEDWKEETVYQQLKGKVDSAYRVTRWQWIVEQCNLAESVVIFGYTRYGKEICDWLIRNGLKDKLYFGDNAEEKQGQRYSDIEVLSLQQTLALPDAIYINTSQRRSREVMEMLLHADISDKCVISYLFRSREYYTYLDERYYEEEIRDILLREVDSGQGVEQMSFSDVKRYIMSSEKYSDWKEKYALDSWICKGDK